MPYAICYELSSSDCIVHYGAIYYSHMSLALYRKYRPRIFADLIGQEPIKVSLQHQVARKQVAHAYLFSGPRGVGKTSTARILARAINCQHPQQGEPDNTCEFCMEILEGRSLDIIEIDAASNTGVDHVREHIIENSRFTPQRLPVKVFIIDEVHMLSSSAFNALLKTLEEPPAHVLFIMATTEVHRVPETILSRCQRFDFQKISIDDLVGRIEGVAKQEDVKLDAEVTRAIARRAHGASRDAEVLLAQLIGLGESHITREQADLVLPRTDAAAMLQLVKAMDTQNLSDALVIIERLSQDGVHIGEFINELIELVRIMIYVKATGKLTEVAQGELDDETAKALPALVTSLPLQRLTDILQTLIRHKQEIRFAPLPQIPLELAVLSIILDEHSSSPQSSVASPPPPPAIASRRTETPAAPQPISTVKKTASQSSLTAKASLSSLSSQPLQFLDTLPVASGHTSFTLESVMNAWKGVLRVIRKDHRGLYLVVKAGTPIRSDERGITLGFPFQLLADQAVSDRSRGVIAAAFQDALSQEDHKSPQVRIHAEVVSREELARHTPQDSSEEAPQAGLSDILESVGGEVVGEE